MDTLVWYDDFISTKISTIIQNKRSKERALFRKDRYAREAFVALLKEKKRSGELNINTKWKELYPLLKNDERFFKNL